MVRSVRTQGPLVSVLVLWLAAGIAGAQEDPVKWSASSKATIVKPGEAFTVELVAEMDEGWHLYSVTQPPPPIATRISVAKNQPYVLDGAVGAPVPEVVFDQNFGINAEYYGGTATFVIPAKVTADAVRGKTPVKVQAFFQACNDEICLPPRTVTVEVPMEITGGRAPAEPPGEIVGSTPPAAPASEAAAGAPAAAGGEAPPAGPETPLAGSAVDTSGSLWAFLWLAMTVGALSLLTPCVFPMIPITVSFFTSQAAGSRGKAVGQAFTYMVGIILTFTAIGMAMALLVGATSLSRFASSPWVNVLLGALFLGFALNLFGFFEIRIPSGLLTRLDAATRQSGGGKTIPTLLMALAFTLTSFTCTAPFIGTLLVMAAGGDWQWPLLGMVAFSTVFSFPFFLLALAPQLMASLPRSGAWMNSVKVMMGFLVVAASTKFISNADVVWGWGLLSRDVVLGSWVAIALLMMAYILGMFRFQHDSSVEHVGIARLATALGCGTLAFWLASGLTGKSLGELDALLPLPSQAAVAAAGAGGAGELAWLVNDYDGALAEARRTNRRVFLDFTGYTCTNCKWMETNMFPRPEVQREFRNFVLVRLYTDGSGEVYERHQQIQQEKYRTVAIPYYAIVEPNGDPVVSFPGLTRNEAEFVSFLQKGRAAGAASAASVAPGVDLP